MIHIKNIKPSKTFLDVFEDISIMTEEKLSKAKEFYNQKKVASKKFKIAGIDPTRGGERLTYSQAEAHEKKMTEHYTQYQTLNKRTIDFKGYAMPMEVFDTIRKRFGLFAIEPSKFNNWYIVPKKNDAFLTNTKREHTRIEGESAVFVYFILPIVGLCLVGWGIYEAINYMGQVWFFINVSIIATMVFSLVKFVKKKRTNKAMRKQKKRDKTLLQKAFPDLTLRNNRESALSIRNALKSATRAAVQISLPHPPEDVLLLMDKACDIIPSTLDWTIWTIADPASIGFTVKERVKRIVREPKNVDPGLVVQYKGFVAVLPDTWYNVTPLEQSFIDEVMQIAEQWDARAYLAN